MKTFLHPDYWVEVPAGEFLTGLSDTQRARIRARVREQVGYERYPASQRQAFESALLKFLERRLSDNPYGPVGNLTDEEAEAVSWRSPLHWVFEVERTLMYEQNRVQPTAIRLNRFYIARFPLTNFQYGIITHDSLSPADLPGALEEQIDSSVSRNAAAVQSYPAISFCQDLGGRLPEWDEWEKAARGVDGRLYPWGDTWDPEAGHFYYGQPFPGGRRVDAFPRGVSPYGAWAMVGGLPELAGGPGSSIGCHAKESSAETAWFDHIIRIKSKGEWLSARPVLDEWPEQQWPGFQAGLAKPSAQALQRMGPLADLLLTQYDWSALSTRKLDTLEPAIVALREGQKLKALDLVAVVLAEDEDNEPAWLLKAAALEEPAEGRKCVQHVLERHPESGVAQKMASILKPPVYFLAR